MGESLRAIISAGTLAAKKKSMEPTALVDKMLEELSEALERPIPEVAVNELLDKSWRGEFKITGEEDDDEEPDDATASEPSCAGTAHKSTSVSPDQSQGFSIDSKSILTPGGISRNTYNTFNGSTHTKSSSAEDSLRHAEATNTFGKRDFSYDGYNPNTHIEVSKKRKVQN